MVHHIICNCHFVLLKTSFIGFSRAIPNQVKNRLSPRSVQERRNQAAAAAAAEAAARWSCFALKQIISLCSTQACNTSFDELLTTLSFQDSSQSDDEKVSTGPLKKRTKPAPAPVANDSDSSEFEDEFDDDLFKGEEDRKWMMTLNELEVFEVHSLSFDFLNCCFADPLLPGCQPTARG